MKRQLLATVSCFALTGVASAADIPARMPVKAPAPVVVTQIWAGPYIGVNGGAVWHQVESDTTLVNFGPFDTAKVDSTGATFGGQIGYNWVSQNFLFGLEADANWTGGKGTDQHIANNGLGFGVVYTSKMTWLATARARAGVTFGPSLLYITGGLAVGGVEHSWTFPTISCLPSTCVLEGNKTKVGWTVGGGFERFITNNLTVKVEGLYVDLGRSTATGSANNNYTSSFKDTAVVGRLGLNLKW